MPRQGEKEFFGPLLPSQWDWFAANGGWAGVAGLARGLGIEVGGLAWRTEGLVGLLADTSDAHLLVTKPLWLDPGTPTGGSRTAHIARTARTAHTAHAAHAAHTDGGACAIVVATMNCNCSGGGATVSLLDGGNGRPIEGFSRAAAALVPSGELGDGVALPLVFGGRGNRTSALPAAAGNGAAGVRFQVELLGQHTGSQLFGITMRCLKPGQR